MLGPNLKLSPQAGLRPVHRRPSSAQLQALGSASGVDALTRELEGSPLFQRLLAANVVRKIRVQGVIPSRQFAAYKLKQALDWVQQHGLEARPEWQRALNGTADAAYLEELARQWNVSEAEMRQALRVLRGDSGQERTHFAADTTIEDRLLAGGSMEGMEAVFEAASTFVSRYHVSQQEFSEFVLSGNYTAIEIARQFKCPAREATQLLEAMTRLHVLQQFDEAAAVGTATSGTGPGPAEEIAEARIGSDGRLDIRLLSPLASLRYVVSQPDLDGLAQSQETQEELRRVLEIIAASNERGSALMAALHALCLKQRAFLTTGEETDLRPLSQSEIAREIGYHRSVVSRLVRDQWLRTPHGRYALRALLPERQEVIARLATKWPGWSDAEIAQHLLQRFGLSLARRTINYHRAKHAGAGASEEK